MREVGEERKKPLHNSSSSSSSSSRFVIVVVVVMHMRVLFHTRRVCVCVSPIGPDAALSFLPLSSIYI